MNLFIIISARKNKIIYRLVRLYVKKYFLLYEETVNGIFIPNYTERKFDLIAELKDYEIGYLLTVDAPDEQKLRFAFFEQLTQTGNTVLKKNKEYLLRYIIYPTINAFKSTTQKNFYIQFPESPSQTKQVSFMFDLTFNSFALQDEKIAAFKSYIERQIQKRLFKKRLIV